MRCPCQSQIPVSPSRGKTAYWLNVRSDSAISMGPYVAVPSTPAASKCTTLAIRRCVFGLFIGLLQLLKDDLDTVRISDYVDAVKIFSVSFWEMVKSSPALKKPYHHGDLRRALVGAALAALADEGLEGLTLRGVARRAGVSRAAPYHYFRDKAELIAAVTVDCYERLAETMRSTAKQATVDPVERLVLLGRIYVEFAVNDPVQFRLMHRPELFGTTGNNSVAASAAGAFAELREAVDLCHREGHFREGSAGENALGCWCAVHGVAALWVDGGLVGHTSAPGELGERVARAFARGLMGL